MNLFDLYSYAQNMFVLANISVFIIEKDSIIKMGVIGRLSWGGGHFWLYPPFRGQIVGIFLNKIEKKISLIFRQHIDRKSDNILLSHLAMRDA